MYECTYSGCIGVCKDKCIDGCKYGKNCMRVCMSGLWIDVCMDGWIDGLMCAWVGARMDVWV